ncbi:hypothetical protein CSE45_2857 [Citreicella sp. SE45]|nr:hypothetical protein CSE45_2857 [Citreicella sp. SE45]
MSACGRGGAAGPVRASGVSGAGVSGAGPNRAGCRGCGVDGRALWGLRTVLRVSLAERKKGALPPFRTCVRNPPGVYPAR